VSDIGQHAVTPPVAQQQPDPEPFYGRCEQLWRKWDGRVKESQSAGDKANLANDVARVAGFVLAAAATLVTTLVSADVNSSFVSATIAAILAAAATVATGIQASGMFGNRKEHHYERVEEYRRVREKAANLKAQVEARAITLEAAFARLDELVDEGRRRPKMPP
jgi:hypothetical protein